jgi:hypothetical protein
MDPFFTSANKRRYVQMDGVQELVDRVRAMPWEKRTKWVDEMWAKRREHKCTKVELCALNAVSFLRKIASHARNRMGAECLANDISAGAALTKTHVSHGFGTTGSHTGPTQYRATKATHHVRPDAPIRRYHDPRK